MEYIDFDEKYKVNEMIINSKVFKYRYYENKESNHTIVLLVGGLGMSDLIYTHFEKLTKDFSVLTFDYSINFKNNEELVDAIYQLIKPMNKKVWFVGQSLGGFIAQIIASSYPDITEGLVLSNTGTISKNLNKKGMDSLYDKINSTSKTKFLLKIMPFSLFKKKISKLVLKKYGKDANEKDLIVLKNLCNIMEEKLEKSYEMHMINLLIDMQNHINVDKDKFSYLEDKVLLLLSNDDHTFSNDVKEELINSMPNPTVNKEITGGHLALLTNPDKYLECVTKYILRKEN